MFVNVEDIDYAAHDALDQLQRAVSDVQTAVYRYGGSLNQILLDDKGTVVTIGWGLALHAHGDNEVRAVRAALDVQRSLKEAGLGSSFGIATGEVFTGLRGNDRRCEYAMIGDTVNNTEAVWLSSMKDQGNNSIAIEGMALSTDAVASLITNLQKSGHFRNVEIKETFQDANIKEMQAFQFTLTCEIDKGKS